MSKTFIQTDSDTHLIVLIVALFTKVGNTRYIYIYIYIYISKYKIQKYMKHNKNVDVFFIITCFSITFSFFL